MSAPPLPVRWLEVDEAGRVVGADGIGELVGRADLALIDLPLLELLTMSARYLVQTHVHPALALHGRLDEVYLNLRGADGQRPLVVATFARRTTPDGMRDVVAVTPMHRRHLYERELVAAQGDVARLAAREREALAREDEVRARLVTAERLASLGQATASMVHELNNPLAYAAANVELLVERARANDPGVVGLLADVREGLGRIRDIIDGMRQLSRFEPPRAVPVELARVVHGALQVARAAVRGRATIEVDLGSRPPWILGDEGRVGQVVLNLVVNAAQAALPERGAANRIAIRAARFDDEVELSVADDGPGVPPALRDRIFEPFFTTKPAGEGTGLGLSVCRELVAALGGTIALDCPADGGAVFRVRLPGAPPQATVATPVDVSAAATGQRRVLVIEDEPAMARALMRVLAGHDVTWFATGAAALAAIERDRLAGYDVVLCDLALPDVGGAELYRRARAEAPEVAERIVFMSGGAQSEAGVRFLASVPNPCLRKPFELRDVRRVVEQVTVGRRAPSSSPSA